MNEGEFHNLLFAYGQVCEEQGLLSEKAVTIRIDIAAHYAEILNSYIEKLNKEII